MVKDTILYDRLNIGSDARPEEIKKAYKRLAFKYHPDKNSDEGAADKFKEIVEAYQILIDINKREEYDVLGIDILTKGTTITVNPFDFLKQMFSQNIQRIILPCTLEELYTGTVKESTFTRRKCCSMCNGTGSKSGKPTPFCSVCKGHGRKSIIMQMGYIREVTEVTCTSCNGSGKCKNLSDDVCDTCSGVCYVSETVTVNVKVPAGAHSGFNIIENGIEFVIQEIEHKLFKRHGNDLVLELEISLLESLSGFFTSVTFLDGTIITINVDLIIDPSKPYKITGKGMPLYRKPDYGDIYCLFKVKYPENIIVDPHLEKILPDRIHSRVIPDKSIWCHLEQ